jgi:GT2 family glycosyltransferase
MVMRALECLERSLVSAGVTARVWLTLNLPEPALEAVVASRSWAFKAMILRNPRPLGFGANHNQAFGQSQAGGGDGWFLVMNPDIFWPEDASGFWHSLVKYGAWPAAVGLVCPEQVDAAGRRQDFARKLITPWGLAWRVARIILGRRPSGVADSVEEADWVNGACVAFRAKAFTQVQGFDERYFMYCEDCDICLRLQMAGWRMAASHIPVVHEARRKTRQNGTHLVWHLSSISLFWRGAVFWRYVLRWHPR